MRQGARAERGAEGKGALERVHVQERRLPVRVEGLSAGVEGLGTRGGFRAFARAARESIEQRAAMSANGRDREGRFRARTVGELQIAPKRRIGQRLAQRGAAAAIRASAAITAAAAAVSAF